MKTMMKQADSHTLILIDEFGTGTEPQIGGAIAEAVLKQFWKKQAWAVITTHYQNLKHFAEDHKGVVMVQCYTTDTKCDRSSSWLLADPVARLP